MDPDVTALLVGAAAGHGQIALLLLAICDGAWSTGRHGIVGLKLLVGVVDKVFFVRHVAEEGGCCCRRLYRQPREAVGKSALVDVHAGSRAFKEKLRDDGGW